MKDSDLRAENKILVDLLSKEIRDRNNLARQLAMCQREKSEIYQDYRRLLVRVWQLDDKATADDRPLGRTYEEV